MAAISRRLFLLGGVSAFPYLYLERSSVAVRRYRVPVRNLPEALAGFTILHLTDLHDKEFGEGGAALLALLRRLRFDLVALTGDLVVGERPSLKAALDLVAGIRRFSNAPLYSVPGNHEYALTREGEFSEKLARAGARVLTNKALPLQSGKDRLWVAGVDDPVTRRARLDQALAETDARSPRILLSHAPHPFPEAAQQGVDLMLSGHTHGGQIRFPLIGAAYVPDMGFFPAWDYGLYSSGKTTLIVNGGLGESWFPVRFNIRPEVVLATLVPLREAGPVANYGVA
ncbi:Metallophosphoesterase [Citrifermentans bremense]|uniref:Metallophosphoesterase n=1 Tax=Citrifermentans bremense TaxID=60035 RepID=A0A6S6MAW9_9BACT|nr:metallophosphoesterase [Citrifermentans bremense]BCG48874.1 Metallophosphoesterase [Citrifermentans bremense]